MSQMLLQDGILPGFVGVQSEFASFCRVSKSLVLPPLIQNQALSTIQPEIPFTFDVVIS